MRRLTELGLLERGHDIELAYILHTFPVRDFFRVGDPHRVLRLRQIPSPEDLMRLDIRIRPT